MGDGGNAADAVSCPIHHPLLPPNPRPHLDTDGPAQAPSLRPFVAAFGVRRSAFGVRPDSSWKGSTDTFTRQRRTISDHGGVRQKRHDPLATSARRAVQDVGQKHPRQLLRPRQALATGVGGDAGDLASGVRDRRPKPCRIHRRCRSDCAERPPEVEQIMPSDDLLDMPLQVEWKTPSRRMCRGLRGFGLS
jgi:hypothetical protein